MTEQAIKLLELLNEGKTCNQICNILNITNQQLYIELMSLKDKGFFFRRQYYSDGSLIYLPMKRITDLNSLKSNNTNVLFTSHDDNTLHCLAISDLHYGNSCQREDLINEIYNYCIQKNIHIIFCCGDIIDGTYSQSERIIKEPYKQIEYFIKNYPFDKNILTFGVMGDHDLTSLKYNLHQDFQEIIYNYRNDIILVLNNEQIVKVKNDLIGLYHKLNTINPQCSLILNGHIHSYCYYQKDNVISIVVPSLSDINHTMPAALDIKIDFFNGYIMNVNTKQLVFHDNKISIFSEVETELPKVKAKVKLPIKYEEYSKEITKSRDE